MHTQHLCTVVDAVSDGVLLWSDFDRQEFRHGHPSAAGKRRAAGVVQTWLPDHNAASGQRGTGESWAGEAKMLKLHFIYLNVVFVRAMIACTCFSLFKTNCRELITLKPSTYDLSLHLSLCVCALVLLMPLPCPPLPLSVTSLRVTPLIVLVSPSLYLHSRSRLSASSSSSSWPPLEAQAQDPLLCCWAPGPQCLHPTAREAWSSQA